MKKLEEIKDRMKVFRYYYANGIYIGLLYKRINIEGLDVLLRKNVSIRYVKDSILHIIKDEENE